MWEQPPYLSVDREKFPTSLGWKSVWVCPRGHSARFHWCQDDTDGFDGTSIIVLFQIISVARGFKKKQQQEEY